MVATLVTPTNRQGVDHKYWVGGANFTPDGSRVVIWSLAGLVVVDVASGRTLTTRKERICAARFASADEVVFHEESNDLAARLWRLRIGASTAVPVGPPRKAEYCRVSQDGTKWLIESYRKASFVDGRRKAKGRVLPVDPDGRLSAAGNRACSASPQGLACVRFPDRRSEQVWSRPTSDDILFDLAGGHALVVFAKDADGIYDDHALVDFEARTVRPVLGLARASGSLFQLHPGAKLLTIGSGAGLFVYDLERGQRRFAAHRPLYGNFAFPYHPRTVVAGTDEPMDLFLVEVP
jgi:hypothetical protein